MSLKRISSLICAFVLTFTTIFGALPMTAKAADAQTTTIKVTPINSFSSDGSSAGQYIVAAKDNDGNYFAMSTTTVTNGSNKSFGVPVAIEVSVNGTATEIKANSDTAEALKWTCTYESNKYYFYTGTPTNQSNRLYISSTSKGGLKTHNSAVREVQYTDNKMFAEATSGLNYVIFTGTADANGLRFTGVDTATGATPDASYNSSIYLFRITEEPAEDPAVTTVIELIEALPAAANVKLTDKDDITAARTAYNALNADQKALVGEDVLNKLKAAEDALAELDSVTIKVTPVNSFSSDGSSAGQYIVAAKDKDGKYFAMSTTTVTNGSNNSFGIAEGIKVNVNGTATEIKASSDKADTLKWICTYETDNYYFYSGTPTGQSNRLYISSTSKGGLKTHASAVREVQFTDNKMFAKASSGLNYVIFTETADANGLRFTGVDTATGATPAASYNSSIYLFKITEEPAEDPAVTAVEGLIEALPAANAVTIGNKAAIEAAKNAYDDLTKEQQGQVNATLVQKLTDVTSALAKIEDDTAKADAVKALINALPAAANVKLTDKDNITAARTAYNALTADQKALVGNDALNKLKAAEDALEAIEKEADDQAAADAVIQKINALPQASAVTIDNKEAIQAARAAYAALTADQKAKIDADTLKKLTDAEDALAQLDNVTISVKPVNSFADDGSSVGEYIIAAKDTQGNYYALSKKTVANGSYTSYGFAEKITVNNNEVKAASDVADNLKWTCSFKTSDNLYYFWTDSSKSKRLYISSSGKGGLKTGSSDREVRYSDNKMYTKATSGLNYVIFNETADTLGLQFTGVDAAEGETPAATYNSNIYLFKISDDQPGEDAAAAKAVEDLIDALPAAADVTLDNKAAIEAAQKAYNALTAEQKALVNETKLNKLTAVAAALATAQAAADQAAADAVEDLIDALPAAANVKLTDKDDITAARTAYNALTADQKALVGDDALNKLKAAEDALAKLDNVTISVKPVNSFADDGSSVGEYIIAAKDTEGNYYALSKKTVANGSYTSYGFAEKITVNNNEVKAASDVADNLKWTCSFKTSDNLYYFWTDSSKSKRLYISSSGKGGLKTGSSDREVRYSDNKMYTKATSGLNYVIFNETADTLGLQFTGVDTAEGETPAATYNSNIYLFKISDDQPGDDAAAAKAVEDLIDALPAAADVTLDNKAAIEAAQKAYNDLTAKQKALVDETKLDKLTDVVAALATAQAAADAEAANSVTALINALPAASEVTLENEEAIKAARTAYNALSTAQKALIDDEILNKLTAAEAALDALQDTNVINVTQVDTLTQGKYIIVAKTVEDNKDVYHALSKDVKTIGSYTSFGVAKTVEASLSGGAITKLTVDKDLVDNLTWVCTTNNSDTYLWTADVGASNRHSMYISGSDKGGIKYQSDDRPVYFENGENLYGLNSDKNKKYYVYYDAQAENDLQFTTVASQGLDDKPGTEYNATIYLLKIADDSEIADAVADQLNDLPVVADVTLEDKAAIEAARKAYDALTPAQKALISGDALKRLTDAEEALAALEKAAEDAAKAKTVSDAIDALPAATSVKLSDKDAIEAARKAYDALTADQKKLVDENTLNKLKAAEAALAAVEKAEQDTAKAKAAADAINALPSAANVKASDKAAIEAARKAYDALTPDQKKLINEGTLKKLTDAEAALKALDGNTPKDDKDEAATKSAKAVTDQINALPANITLSNKDAVAAARKAYNALSAEAKAKVSNDTLAKLTKAEQTIKDLQEYDAAVNAAKKIKAKLKSVKAQKGRKALVKWKKVKDVSGYEIRYSTKKSFKKGVKKAKVKKGTTTKKTIKKLKAGKTYYVQIRTIKKVPNKATGTTTLVYGKWSNKKKVKAKN